MTRMKLGEKVIIAGTRTFTDRRLLHKEVKRFLREHGLKDPDIVCGTPWDRKKPPVGADQLGAEFAYENMLYIINMPAHWDVHGRAAGPIRNEEMAKVGGYCIAFWDGESPGTANMIKHAKAYELELRIVNYVTGEITNYGKEKSTR